MLCALTNDVDDPLREPYSEGYLERPSLGVCPGYATVSLP